MNKIEKNERKSLKQMYKAKEQEQISAALPVSVDVLKDLFDWLDKTAEKQVCDNTLSQTLIFLEKNDLKKDELIDWLKERGGYCDCEVLANVAEHFESE